MRNTFESDAVIGKTFGKLKVVEYVGKKMYGDKQRHAFRCECECGGEKVAIYDSLKNEAVRSCGCLRWVAGKNNPKWTGFGDISGNYWDHVKRGAKTRDFEFSISIEEAWKKFEEQKGICAISGIAISLESRQNKRSMYGSASLDRINSKQGYTSDNIQWVHKDINRMKQHFDESHFIKMCKIVSEHQRDSNE